MWVGWEYPWIEASAGERQLKPVHYQTINMEPVASEHEEQVSVTSESSKPPPLLMSDISEQVPLKHTLTNRVMFVDGAFYYELCLLAPQNGGRKPSGAKLCFTCKVTYRTVK